MPFSSPEQWLAALRGPERDEALVDLRAVLVRGLRVALGASSDDLPEAAIEDFTQEALVKILHSLASFRGESRFTTWAQRIEASARLDTLTDPLPAPEKLMT